MGNFPSRDQIKALQERFPAGTRIRLNHMGSDPRPVEDGMTGTVRYVDDIGSVHMRWDNGRGLALIPDEDDFTIITNDKEEEK